MLKTTERIGTKSYKVKASLIERLSSGKIRSGEKLPSVRNMSKDFNVSPLTVSIALGEMSASGLINIKPGVGTFACSKQVNVAPKKIIIGLTHLWEDLSYSHKTPHISRHISGFKEYFPDNQTAIRLLQYKKGHLMDETGDVRHASESGEVQGLLICGPITSEEVDLLTDHNIPIVLCEHLVPERATPTVLINWIAGFRALLSILLKAGHKKIELITYSQDWIISMDRGQSYIKLARSMGYHDFGPQNINIIDNTLGIDGISVYDAIVRTTLQKKPSAIVAFDEVIANRIVRYAYKCNLHVPNDISIVAMNDMAPGTHTVLLTSLDIQTSIQNMTYEACGLLDKCLQGRSLNERVMINPSVIHGESVGPAL